MLQFDSRFLNAGFTYLELKSILGMKYCIYRFFLHLFKISVFLRYGSVKSAHRRTGKVKGIERILGTMETLQESLIEVTSGQAKYEHHHKALVWRCPRLPKDGQGAYTTHQLVCRLALTGFDQVPSDLAEHAFVEFTMPACQGRIKYKCIYDHVKRFKLIYSKPHNGTFCQCAGFRFRRTTRKICQTFSAT